ncbi:bifunctional riboflavin kinase/FAD synthetase [Thioalkalivibrio sp. HK1]|uniref:bifunctional riboflavin kinase/FAD synthetase n=1 Tax=Thioalkalivibrio sp. HK1 TaxID=1469245 RepID=UPI0004BC71CA|nr:bifunctional riboflavin kinase/FAD synthetase [Thioalkalivibrio sp. HK1]
MHARDGLKAGLELIRGRYSLRPEHRGCVATIGNYDGVHRGHRALLDQLDALASEHGLPSTLITFDPSPQEFFSASAAPPRLTSLREKIALLSSLPLDRVLLLRFDEHLRRMTWENFVDIVLVKGLGVRAVLVGDDFRFGHKGEGDFDRLLGIGAKRGFEVVRIETFSVRERRVSSSWVRKALALGDLALARDLLGRDYSIGGRVRRGDARGRTIGFPTLNLPMRGRRSALLGIYAVRVKGLGDRVRDAVAYVGPRPTVGGTDTVLEVHVFDWTGDAYGRYVEVVFVAHIRGDRKFDSLDALKDQIVVDSADARSILENRAKADG